jgi:Lar family restriction alleviation protein
MSAPELKPCPFCGEAASMRDDTYHKTAVFISCGTLGCFGSDQWDEEEADAVKAWNTRADLCDPMQDERVKRLVQALRDVIAEYERGLAPLSDDIYDARAALRDMGAE